MTHVRKSNLGAAEPRPKEGLGKALVEREFHYTPIPRKNEKRNVRSLYRFYELGAEQKTMLERLALADQQFPADQKSLSQVDLRTIWLEWINKSIKLKQNDSTSSSHPLMWVNFLPPSEPKESEYFFQLLTTDEEFAARMIHVLEKQHTYVQWFLPTKKQSRAQSQEPYMDQTLDGKLGGDQAKFQQLAPDAHVKKLMLARIKLMLWFYGFDPAAIEQFLIDSQNGELKEREAKEREIDERKEEGTPVFFGIPAITNILKVIIEGLQTTQGPANSHFKNRIQVWPVIGGGHNLLRCTRFIESCLDVGDPWLAEIIFMLLMYTALNDSVASKTIPVRSLGFWIDTMRKYPGDLSLKFYAGLVAVDTENKGHEKVFLISKDALGNFISYRNTLEDTISSVENTCWACFYTTESLQRKNVKIKFLNYLIEHLPHANSRKEITEIVKSALKEDPDRVLAGISSNVKYYVKKALPWLDLDTLQAEVVREKAAGMSLI